MPRRLVLERPSLQVLHDEEGLPLVLADVVDGADVRMVEGRGRLRLALESLLGDRVAEQLLGKKLERHEAMQPLVLRLVDDAPAAAGQPPDDAVVGDGLADQGPLPGPGPCRAAVELGRWTPGTIACQGPPRCRASIPSTRRRNEGGSIAG
jgi:hypothetical protein